MLRRQVVFITLYLAHFGTSIVLWDAALLDNLRKELLTWVALSTPGPMQAAGERGWIVDDAPPTPLPATHRVAALDAGVDWERVERAPDPAPMAVAAYER